MMVSVYSYFSTAFFESDFFPFGPVAVVPNDWFLVSTTTVLSPAWSERSLSVYSGPDGVGSSYPPPPASSFFFEQPTATATNKASGSRRRMSSSWGVKQREHATRRLRRCQT